MRTSLVALVLQIITEETETKLSLFILDSSAISRHFFLKVQQKPCFPCWSRVRQPHDTQKLGVLKYGHFDPVPPKSLMKLQSACKNPHRRPTNAQRTYFSSYILISKISERSIFISKQYFGSDSNLKNVT